MDSGSSDLKHDASSYCLTELCASKCITHPYLYEMTMCKLLLWSIKYGHILWLLWGESMKFGKAMDYPLFFWGGGGMLRRETSLGLERTTERWENPPHLLKPIAHTHTQNIHSLTHTCTSICTKLKSSGAAGSCASALMCVKQSATCVHACVYAVA